VEVLGGFVGGVVDLARVVRSCSFLFIWGFGVVASNVDECGSEETLVTTG